MGKAKKIKVSKGESSERAKPKISLAEQIAEDSEVKIKNRLKIRVRKDEEEEYVDSKITQKILSQARRQQQEIEEESGIGTSQAVKKPITKLGNESDDEMSSDEEIAGNEYYDDFVVDENELIAYERFMNKGVRTLGDEILRQVPGLKTDIEAQCTDARDPEQIIKDIDPRVISMYKGVGDVLTKYRSGKLPKAFKIIPSLKNWEQILFLTNPHSWSAAAMYQATRIFASNLKEKMAQKFYYNILLPRIRDDIREYQRLNFHLYQALRKALFKPGAFMKGIILPILQAGDSCTLREAIIIGSVLAKNSVPILHSAAAMLKIAEMDYTGANSIFLRILFDKKYALPYKVVDAVVFHFLRFEREKRELPVLWHQALLTFVQRYKNFISSEQNEALLELLKKQKHHSLTPEIRRELQSAKTRDAEIGEHIDESMENESVKTRDAEMEEYIGDPMERFSMSDSD